MQALVTISLAITPGPLHTRTTNTTMPCNNNGSSLPSTPLRGDEHQRELLTDIGTDDLLRKPKLLGRAE
jgi:hypothetical protein